MADLRLLASVARRLDPTAVDVSYVAEMLGHSSPVIIAAIYQHTGPERKREAADRIGAAIFR